MDNLDQVECLQSYVKVLKNNKLTLTGNSVEIKDIGRNKVKIKVTYCGNQTLKLLVKMEKPLDFIIISDILPKDYFDNQEYPASFDDFSLNELLTWILLHIKSFMISKLELFPHISPLSEIIASLLKDEVIVQDGYDIIVDDERTTLLLKFQPERAMDLVNLQESVSSNKLQNVTEQFFILKLVIKSESGQLLPSEFGILFSPSLISSMPDLDEVMFPGLDVMLRINDLMTNLLEIRRFVNHSIQDAYQGYLNRRSCLMMIYNTFSDTKVLRPSLDTTSMSKIQLGFNHKTMNYIWEILLGTRHPETAPKAIFHAKKVGEDQVKSTRLRNEQVGFHPNMTDEEICEVTLAMIEDIFNRLDN